MFADDLILVGKASEEQIDMVMRVLDTFCKASGQAVNAEKTCIYFSKNDPENLRQQLVVKTGFVETNNLGKYLGIPLLGKAPRYGEYHYLIEKVQAKLSGWKAHHLSFAGRVLLSKTVIQSIPIYPMMTTPLPNQCLKEIQQLQRGFIRGEEPNHRKVHLVNWETLILPKKYGGLGLKNLHVMNQACLIKLGWQLRSGQNSLWCNVLLGKYDRGELGDRHLTVREADSFLWKVLADLWPKLYEFEAWVVGHGDKVSFWWDKWIDQDRRIGDTVLDIPLNCLQAKVVDFVTREGHWDLETLHRLLPGELYSRVQAILPPSPELDQDRRIWPSNRLGEFSVSSAYSLLCDFGRYVADPIWKALWTADMPERVRLFVW